MILYHGTTLEIRQPGIIRREIGRDFGFAFYTTDIQEQAERWALRRAKIESRLRHSDCSGVVNEYDWDEDLSGLSYKKYEKADLEWLEMVMRCRSDIHYSHGFDIVEGKIANDNVGETVSFVMQGIMRKEDAVDRLRFERINNQIAFCSDRALDHLHFVKSYAVEE